MGNSITMTDFETVIPIDSIMGSERSASLGRGVSSPRNLPQVANTYKRNSKALELGR